MNFEDMPNSAYAAYLQSKKAEGERRSNEQYVPGMTGVTWRHLVDSINRYIVKNADELSSEDKQLGVYFIGKETLCKEQTGETDVVLYGVGRLQGRPDGGLYRSDT